MSNIPTCLICYHETEVWLTLLSFSHWVFLGFFWQMWKLINYMTCKSNGFDSKILCNINVLLLFYLFYLLLFNCCFISSICPVSIKNSWWVKLHARLLREPANVLAKLLSIIFERLWRSGDFSMYRGRQILPPSSKKGKKDDLGICKPVSLTSAPENIMEQVLLELISGHMQKRKVSGNSQHGFTKGKSDVTHCLLWFTLSLAELLQSGGLDN